MEDQETKPETTNVPDVRPYLELLGQTARDKITGLQGTIVSVSFDLFGCVQAVLAPPLPVDKDGNKDHHKKPESFWLDVNRLDIVRRERVMPIPPYAARPTEHTHGPADKPASCY